MATDETTLQRSLLRRFVERKDFLQRLLSFHRIPLIFTNSLTLFHSSFSIHSLLFFFFFTFLPSCLLLHLLPLFLILDVFYNSYLFVVSFLLVILMSGFFLLTGTRFISVPLLIFLFTIFLQNLSFMITLKKRFFFILKCFVNVTIHDAWVSWINQKWVMEKGHAS